MGGKREGGGREGWRDNGVQDYYRLVRVGLGMQPEMYKMYMYVMHITPHICKGSISGGEGA